MSLSNKLRGVCNDKGEELEPKETAKVLHSLGKVYRQRSPNKLDLIRSVILFVAALVRNSDNKDEIKKICMMFLIMFLNLLMQSALSYMVLINEAHSMKQIIQHYRSKVEQWLETNDFSENSRENINTIEDLQNKIYRWYCNLMKNIINICQNICDDASCQYAVIGMGSLAIK